MSELTKASVAANRAQFERQTGRKLAEGERRLRHPKFRWMGAVLDGRLEDGTLLEAKFAPASLTTAAGARQMFFATVGWRRPRPPLFPSSPPTDAGSKPMSMPIRSTSIYC